MFLFRALVSFMFVSSVPAQTVWSMGSPWTDLATVIALAAPGDVVLLNGMPFAPFSLNKGLTLLGPSVIQPSASIAGPTTLTIPPGQHAHIADVDFSPSYLSGSILLGGHRVDANGSVSFENCTFRQGNPQGLVTSGTVLLHHCTVIGNPGGFLMQSVGGMLVNAGYCSLVDCTVRGGDSMYFGALQGFVAATPALRVNFGATVSASNTSFDGGSGDNAGVFGTSVGITAVQLAGTGYLTDCVLTAGTSPGAATPPALIGSSSTFYARTVFAPGTGTMSNAPELVGFHISQGLRLGQTSTVTATAGSNSVLGILGGFDGTATTTHPLVVEPILGSLAQLVPLTVAIPAAGGAVPCPIAVPHLAALVGFAVYLQAFQFDGLGVRASAAIGSVVH